MLIRSFLRRLIYSFIVATINEKVLVGSMGALSLMTVLSVIIGRIFHSVPAQFQTSKF